MADITGALYHQHGEKTYTLRLTMRGIAKAQGIFGNGLNGLLTGEQGIPDFGVCLFLVAAALENGEGLSGEDAADLADEMLTADPHLITRLLAAFSPSGGGSGNAVARPD